MWKNLKLLIGLQLELHYGDITLILDNLYFNQR